VEATEAVGEEVVRIVDAYVNGRVIPNCVNLARESGATHQLVVRHADRVGVLAGVLDALRQAGINVQEMQNIVFSGGEAACARIEIVGEPDGETLARIGADEAVFDASVTPID
jgi:D-3-phosphoglycerate dehydrogenase